MSSRFRTADIIFVIDNECAAADEGRIVYRLPLPSLLVHQPDSRSTPTRTETVPPNFRSVDRLQDAHQGISQRCFDNGEWAGHNA